MCGKRASYFQVIIASGVLAVRTLLALVACATTTNPVSRQVDPAFARKVVAYPSPAPPGTVIVDPGRHFLYLVQGGGQAIRYWVSSALRPRVETISPLSRNASDTEIA